MPDITVYNKDEIARATGWAVDMLHRGIQGGPVVIEVKREGRSVSQNAKLWPMLTDISKQIEWFGAYHSAEVWKDLITGTFRQCVVLPNLDGTGFVMTGLSTSRLSKSDFSQLIEYIFQFGAEKEVRWSDPAMAVFDEYRQAR